MTDLQSQLVPCANCGTRHPIGSWIAYQNRCPSCGGRADTSAREPKLPCICGPHGRVSTCPRHREPELQDAKEQP